MSLLEVTSVSKSFAKAAVLHDVSFHADEGEIVSLLGPSGCGKTTLLRIIAGLETADSGQVTFDGRVVDGVPAHRRGFGLMFQDYALFPHRDVVANVAFGLRMQGLPRAQVEARVVDMLDLVGLAGYERRRVYDLSGGEQQRVALARSLAPGPRLLMLDEPLGSLDRALREDLMNELRSILNGVGLTAVYVTHDQQEAFAIADRVIIMHRGRIVQQGTPQAVYRQPASPWVARFLGLGNLIPGRVAALEPPRVDTALGLFVLGEAQNLDVGREVTVLVRPNAARPTNNDTSEEGVVLEGKVHDCSFRGGHCRLVVKHESGLNLSFELPSDVAPLPQPGETITLALRLDATSLLVEEARSSGGQLI
jgi:ABC-type Fe3+/spermidine/putrescine transport system ATPase subunit